ncbi:hypothetical protein KAR91_15705 [Candidatus Pacearchaeota archaeon]|nr:hypothetical protein [Candidatus Pacearchaeota archaeon]
MRIREEDLSEGEVICNKCLGAGEILRGDIQYMDEICSKCWGTGKIDWIENVMGKQPVSLLNGDPDGAVDLYYHGNKIIETTKDGIRIY